MFVETVYRPLPAEVHRHHQHAGSDLVGHPGNGLRLSAPAAEPDLFSVLDVKPHCILRVDLHIGFGHLVVEDLRPSGLRPGVIVEEQPPRHQGERILLVSNLRRRPIIDTEEVSKAVWRRELLAVQDRCSRVLHGRAGPVQ